MLAAGLIASRFVHYLAVLALFGVALCPLYFFHRGERVQPILLMRLRRTMLFAAVAAVITGAAWFVCSIATMSDSFAAAFDPGTFWSVVQDTTFGQIWFWRFGLGIVTLALSLGALAWSTQRFVDLLVLAASSVLLASIAGTGHTQSYERALRLIHMISDGAHLIVAGAWIGGLIALALLLAPSTGSSPIESHRILVRFSAIGTVAVATLIGTGLINGWLLVGTLSALISTPYGQLLIAKIGAFGAMVALAGLNRIWLTPALARESLSNRPPKSLARLRYHIYAEQALGIAVIFIVAVLGTMQPAAVPA